MEDQQDGYPRKSGCIPRKMPSSLEFEYFNLVKVIFYCGVFQFNRDWEFFPLQIVWNISFTHTFSNFTKVNVDFA